MTKRETNCPVRDLKVWATAGLMLILILSSGPAQAGTTKYKVDTVRYDNKGSYLASPMVVFQYTKTVKCQIILRDPIPNPEHASYNL